MDEQARKRRSRRGRYPLFVGVLALGAVVAPTYFDGADYTVQGEQDGAVKPDAASVAARSPARGRLWWRVTGHTQLPKPLTITQCIRQAGYGPVLTTRASNESSLNRSPHISIIHAKLPRPATIGFDHDDASTLDLRTPVGQDRRLPIALHLAVAACLRNGATGLVDPDLGRRFELHHWPTASSGGGMPVDAFVDIQHRSGIVTTLGLTRLGLPELALLASGDPDADAHTVRHAASTVIASAGSVPGTVELKTGLQARIVDVENLRGAAWLPTSVASEKHPLAFLLQPDPASTRPLSRRISPTKTTTSAGQGHPHRRPTRARGSDPARNPSRRPSPAREVPARTPASKPFMPDYR